MREGGGGEDEDKEEGQVGGDCVCVCTQLENSILFLDFQFLEITSD